MKKILIMVILAFVITGCKSNKSMLKLKSDTYKVEYGEDIKTTVDIYIDLTNINDKEKEKLLAAQAIMDIPEAAKIINDGKTYVAIGEYKGKVTYGKEEALFKVAVEDTTNPELTGPETLELIQGYDLILDGLFTAKDISSLKDIQYDTSAINKDESGEYLLKVSVEDIANNQTTKEVKVTVKPKDEVTIQEGTSQLNSSHSTDAVSDTNTNSSQNANNSSQGSTSNSVSQSLAASLSASNNTPQLLTVIGTGATTADFALHEYRNGVWTEVLSCNARVGTNGIGSTTEWSRTTPNGVFSLGMNFGLNNNPGATYGYTQVNSNHYWIDDVNSKYYNQFVDITEVDEDWSSAEHITDFPGYYNYCVNINYNPNCTPGVGSAIFIHCDVGEVTYGCVAIPESNLATVMRRLQSDALIAIYPSYDDLY